MVDVFKVDEADRGYDSLEAYCHNGRLTVQIEEPFAGDTETGFGRTCSIGLSLDNAEAFAHWLIETVEAARKGVPRPSASEAD